MNKALIKRKTKRILAPLTGPILRVAYVSVFGKHIFINKYVKRVPVANRVVAIIEDKAALAHTANSRNIEYRQWVRKNYPKKKELVLQQKHIKEFKHKPLISVVMPTYNTNPTLLKQCLDSVIKQSYTNWELCIADDASTNKEVVEILEDYAKKHTNIKYMVRDQNGHICKASNSALKLAKGEFVSLLDHDDVLWPNALYEVVKVINNKPKTDFIYSDEDKIDEAGKKHSNPFFKPDWSPEYLRSVNYITHFSTIRKKLIDKVGGFRPGYEGAQDWDLFLRISRITDKIEHIPSIIYSWRMTETSTAQDPSAKEYAYKNQKKALLDDVKERGMKARIDWQIPYSMWRIGYEVKDNPLVSIIIPTKDQYDYIKRCLDSIKEKTKYENFEIVLMDTGSTDERVWQLYEEHKTLSKSFRLVKWTKKFNFAAVCDEGAKKAKGKYYLFLNNDTEVITESWIEDMLGYAQQKDIGAVGCKLYYPDGKLQHGGIILGVGGLHGTPGIAGHFFPAFKDKPTVQDLAQSLYVGGTRNFTAVTAAVLMVENKKFWAVDGFDPKYRIAFNDVDFCLKLYDSNLRNVYLPHVELFHHESISVGQPGSKVRDVAEFDKEIQMMLKSWKSLIENDPYYHPEFRRDVASARLRD